MPNVTFQIGPKRFLLLKVPWTYLKEVLNGEEIIGTSYEKELQMTNQKKLV